MVAVGGHGDDRGVRLAEYFAVVGHRRSAEPGGKRFCPGAIGIRDGDQLHPAQRGELLGVVAAHMACANDSKMSCSLQ